MSGSSVPATIYEAFARGDLAAVLAQLDPQVEWRMAEGHPYSPQGETWIGRDQVVEKFFLRAGGDWDGFRIAVTDLYDAGDTVIAEVRYSGTFRPTGRELDAQGCHVWKLRRGKVTVFQQYADTSRLQAVMGEPNRERSRD